jgi:hypothetical protein
MIRSVFILILSLIALTNAASVKSAKQLIHSSDNDVVTWHFGSYLFPENKSVKFDLAFYAPKTPGSYQVIVFLPGLNGAVLTSNHNKSI